MQTSSRSSIRDVAERAGVSAVTVSNVLRGRSSRASAETRDRVLEAARALNYVPVAQPATQSRKTQTQVIGLVFDQVSIRDNWGFPTFLGLQSAGVEHGYDLLTVLRAQPEWMAEADEARFLDRRTDGFIFVVPNERDSVLETLVHHRIPAVVCYTTGGQKGVAEILIDNAEAMRQTTGYLISQGHTRILHLAQNIERSDFLHRRQGYEETMRGAGLEAVIFDGHGIWEDEREKMLLETIAKHNITALACSSDATAAEAWDLAEANGIQIPEELSITGMDDLPEHASRGLTTVSFSCEDIGRWAVEAILRMGQGDSAESCSKNVPVELIVRESVRPPRS